MTFPHARVIAIVAVLGLVSAFAPETRLHAQTLGELTVRANAGNADAQFNLGTNYFLCIAVTTSVRRPLVSHHAHA